MATDAGYAKYVCDQLQATGGITVLKMFGEYALYRHGKVVALIADNQFFVKPTPAGEAVLGVPTYGPPYPGAKPFFNVSDLLDDPETLVRLIEATYDALPAPKKKAAKKPKLSETTAKPTARKSAGKAKPGTKPKAKVAARKPSAKKSSAAKPPARKSPARKSPASKSSKRAANRR